MKIVFEENQNVKELDFFEKKLFSFNCSKVENYSYENFIFKATTESNMIIAGIHGQIGGNWLYIASLWVDENYRGKGIGKKLLFLAEKTAFERNCHGAYLYTYSFQGPKFYEKFGYITMGKLENFSGDHTKFFMKKTLA